MRLGLIVFVAAVASACGGGGPESSGPATPAPTVSPVNAETAGNIAGKITFEGTAPKPGIVRMDSDPNCVQAGAPSTDETVVVGDAGALQNVFVYVKDGLGNLRFPIPSASVVLDQKGCHYVPHVLGVQVGQNTSMTLSPSSLGNTTNNWIGRSQYASDAYLDGQVDGFRIYNRALSASEIKVRCNVMFRAPRELKDSSIVQLIEQ